jgi:hypothetical protein
MSTRLKLGVTFAVAPIIGLLPSGVIFFLTAYLLGSRATGSQASLMSGASELFPLNCPSCVRARLRELLLVSIVGKLFL